MPLLFKPSKTKLIVLLVLASMYLLVTLLYNFYLYSFTTIISAGQTLLIRDIMNSCAENQQITCRDVQESHDSLLRDLKSIGENKLSSLEILQAYRTFIFPGNPYVALVGEEFHYQNGSLNLVVMIDFFITPLFILQLLAMLGYWYLVGCMIDSAIWYFKRNSKMS